MEINQDIEAPFEIKLSFQKLFNQYEKLLDSENTFIAQNAKRVLQIAEQYPFLKEGFTNTEYLDTHKTQISEILYDSFNPLLTNNEIKTATIPFHNIIFNSSERFKSIMKAAGEEYKLKVINMPDDQTYIIACAIILNFCYGYDINFKRPFFYEIPDANGITRYYKILYNAEFIEVIPKENAPQITQEDFDELIDNFDNIELWKSKFPANSYEFSGFIISNMFDVTDDQSISNIKSTLIGSDKRKNDNFIKDFHEIFQSLFGLQDIKVGFSIYNKESDTFERVYGVGMHSYLLDTLETKNCSDALCNWSYDRLLKEKEYFTISNVNKYYSEDDNVEPHIKVLHNQGIQSAIFAPIANEDGLMGILEIVSEKPKLLNSVNANKLIDVMPFIVSAVERSKEEEENLVEAIIQTECTSIHPSVHWRFAQEAKNYIKAELNGLEPYFKKIAFEEVYPLYGQMDIKGSSEARNLATEKDLTLQLQKLNTIISEIIEIEPLTIYEQYQFQLSKFSDEVKADFQVDSEHKISSYIKSKIEPFLKHKKFKGDLGAKIKNYFDSINNNTHTVYHYRRQFDETITIINREMASLLDQKQIDAQSMYPHFFERYKTDGVEHNMYIGESITKEDSFNPLYLYNLRLWQLQVMCEMENSYYKMKSQSKFPVKLDVASMILVFNQPMSISFRMDEKQFDVDGTYNARYEIVKKRVDKAYIKGTTERVTQQGKIAIVYSQAEDEKEYLRYIKFLQSKNYLDTDVEIVELQDLQAVTGLKAIRVSILYNIEENEKTFYTYDDLMTEIKS